jgi:DNA-binding response OmpR family regulator
MVKYIAGDIMANILIVDDDENIRELLDLYLKNAGFDTILCTDAGSALSRLEAGGADIALLDVMLPDIKGFELCKSIKERFDLPVIMITARDMLHDKIQGFNSGADDYIVKPFEPAEVIARVNARLRKPRKSAAPALSTGSITVDIDKYEVRKNGEAVDLKPKEIQLFHYLLLNKNLVLSRETLLQNVWNYDFAGDTRTVDVHINTLRQKLLEGETGWDIKTVWGVGYKLEST